jgi:hypothetical protein
MVSFAAEAASAGARPHGFLLRTVRDRPVAAACALCLLLALLSVLLLSWIPSSDPYAWIDWGQEIASRITGSPIGLGLAGGPSWKPFPAIFTSLFGFFGAAAPKLWLLLARTAGLLALVAAFRLGRRFAGPLAGIAAALALCLLDSWLFYIARGASEPIVAALTLWAIDRHLSAAPRSAGFLMFLAALNRPEFSPFLAVYAVYLWVRVPGARTLAVLLLVLVPVAWLVPPLLITGDAFQAGGAALAGKGSPGSAIAELRSAPTLITPAVLVLAAVGFVMALRDREATLQWLGVGALAWALMVAIMTQVAYGLPRYLLPAATIACLLAGVALARLAELARHWVGARRPPLAGLAPALAVTLIVIATLPWSIPRAQAFIHQAHDADRAAYLQKQLFLAAERAGGKRAVLPCRSSHVAINHTVASALAWKLKVPLRRVRPLMRGTGFVFRAPHFIQVGIPPAIVHASSRRVRQVVAVPPWVVLEVQGRTTSGPPRCAGGDRA